MKKIIAAALAFTLVVTLAACGGKPGDATQAQQPALGGEAGKSEEKKASVQMTDGTKAEVLLQDGFYRLDTNSSLEIKGLSLDEPKSEDALVTITGSVDFKGMDEGASAWIGIVPSDIPHGSEEAVDQEDLIYSYLSNLENGTYFFQLELAPGSYDIRICDSDDGGVEVAFLPFTVK